MPKQDQLIFKKITLDRKPPLFSVIDNMQNAIDRDIQILGCEIPKKIRPKKKKEKKTNTRFLTDVPILQDKLSSIIKKGYKSYVSELNMTFYPNINKINSKKNKKVSHNKIFLTDVNIDKCKAKKIQPYSRQDINKKNDIQQDIIHENTIDDNISIDQELLEQVIYINKKVAIIEEKEKLANQAKLANRITNNFKKKHKNIKQNIKQKPNITLNLRDVDNVIYHL